jgi:hypothetical protein
MKETEQHVNSAAIRDFAYGLTLLQPNELRHFQDCDECCAAWWRLKQEAKREKGDDAKEKSA